MFAFGCVRRSLLRVFDVFGATREGQVYLQEIKKGCDLLARPLKDGVLYFPKDVDFYDDDKVKLLRAEFGAKGMYLLDYLLCELYGKEGYYLEWGEEKCGLVSDGAGCGLTPDFVSEFVDGCVRRSFFDKRVFDVFGVLTSCGIQARYVRMFNGRSRIVVFEEYFLLDLDDEKQIPDGALKKLAFKSIYCKENPDKTKENLDKLKENATNKRKRNKNKYPSDINENKENVFGFSEEMQTAWEAFKKMRADKHNSATSDEEERMMYEQLCKWAPGDEELQIEIVRQSVLRGWKHLYPLKKAAERGSSFDIDEFFAAAVQKAYK